MPIIHTTFAGLPVEAEYDWSDMAQGYLLTDWTIAGGMVDLDVCDLAIRRESRLRGDWVMLWFTLADHLDQLVAEHRAEWDRDARMAARELERGDG